MGSTAARTPQASRPKKGQVFVRCLGPAKQEHSFWSNWVGNRVCTSCRQMIEARTCARLETPVTVIVQ